MGVDEEGTGRRMPTWLRRLAMSPVPVLAALSIYLLWVHEPWRDEAQAWLIVRDAPSFSALRHALSYEGTPALWHALLLPLAKLGLPFMAARLLAAALAVGCAGLLWLFSPFPRWLIWLLSLSYFVAYEYDAIARSYVLAVVLLLALATLDRKRVARPFLYAGLLALLANVSVHGLLVATVLGGAFALELTRTRQWSRVHFMAAGLAVAAIGLAGIQILPPHDVATNLTGWDFGLSFGKLKRMAEILVETFLPVPGPGVPFWNITYVQTTFGSAFQQFLGVALYAMTVLILRRHRRALWTWVAGSVVLLLFFVVKDYRGARNAGLLFTLFVYTLWLSLQPAQQPEISASQKKGRRSRAPTPKPARLGTVAMVTLGLVLFVQCLGTAVAVHNDTVGKFSEGTDAARFLEAGGFIDNRTVIVAFHSYVAASILAELKDPNVRFFFPEFQEFGSYTIWNQQGARGENLTLDEILAQAPTFGAGLPHNRMILVLSLSDNLVGTQAAQDRLTPVTQFVPDYIGSWRERFLIFNVAPPTPATG